MKNTVMKEWLLELIFGVMKVTARQDIGCITVFFSQPLVFLIFYYSLLFWINLWRKSQFCLWNPILVQWTSLWCFRICIIVEISLLESHAFSCLPILIHSISIGCITLAFFFSFSSLVLFSFVIPWVYVSIPGISGH